MARGPDYQKHRGARQRARIVEALAAGPLSSRALADRLHLAPKGMYKYLNALMATPRQVRITGYLRSGGCPVPLYGLGSGRDAARPGQLSRRTGSRWEKRRAEVLALLATPQSVQELADAIGICPTAIRAYLRELHRDRAIYITRWLRVARTLAPVYVLGEGDDAERLAPLPRRTSMARVRSGTWAAALFTQGASA